MLSGFLLLTITVQRPAGVDRYAASVESVTGCQHVDDNRPERDTKEMVVQLGWQNSKAEMSHGNEGQKLTLKGYLNIQ